MHFDGHGTFRNNLGYLVFEDESGKADLVDAKALGKLLNQRVPGLIVLSAYQSATVAGETALGSVAARLTQAGTSTVIAMSYSVLAVTTQKLFGEFYENLVQGQQVGESLDNARRRLINDQKRGERSRGQERVVMRLEDWFVPTLYQSGSDRGMIVVAEARSPLTPLEKAGWFHTNTGK